MDRFIRRLREINAVADRASTRTALIEAGPVAQLMTAVEQIDESVGAIWDSDPIECYPSDPGTDGGPDELRCGCDELFEPLGQAPQ